MTILLDGLLMQTRAAAHDHLKQQLNLPGYYGRNLDALFDLLMEISKNTVIHLIHKDQMIAVLGSYGEILLETLQQVADENRNLTFTAE